MVAIMAWSPSSARQKEHLSAAPACSSSARRCRSWAGEGISVMSVRQWACGFLVLMIAPPLCAKPPRPLDVESDDLRPGLVARYRSLTDREAILTRIDLKPAFH